MSTILLFEVLKTASAFFFAWKVFITPFPMIFLFVSPQAFFSVSAALNSKAKRGHVLSYESCLVNLHIQVTLAYGGCTRSTSGSQNLTVIPKRHENSHFLRS